MVPEVTTFLDALLYCLLAPSAMSVYRISFAMLTVWVAVCLAHCGTCRIADPEASKPDDWDEDAPKEIVDEESEKPEGWLDDEPEEIDDPGSFACRLVALRR